MISQLTSRYEALLLSLRRRAATGLDFAFSYTLSRATSELGQGLDETGLGPNTIQDATDPFAAVQDGPAASDATHLVSLSAIIPLPWRMQVSPLFYYRSALPVFVVDGIDRNNDFVNNDIPDRAFAFDDVGQPPRDIGSCRTINCGRGAASSQVSLRLSRPFELRAFFGLGIWMPLGVVALFLLISGPSMLIAWLKLRRRNLGPILDANGWAVNARAKINIPFGGSLTKTASLPLGSARDLVDPFAESRSGRNLSILILILRDRAGCLLVFGCVEKYLPGVCPKSPWVKKQEQTAPATESPASTTTAPSKP